MHNVLRKGTALLMAILMLVGAVPQTAYAYDEVLPADGIEYTVVEETEPVSEAETADETESSKETETDVETADGTSEVSSETVVETEASVDETADVETTEAGCSEAEIEDTALEDTDETTAMTEEAIESEATETAKETEAEVIEKTVEPETEEEVVPEPFAEIAKDSFLFPEQLGQIDFSSKRLLIAGTKILDPENVLSEYDGMYLMQYEDETKTRNAYSYYYGKAAFVEVDSVIEVAEGDGDQGAVGSDEMTEDKNPLTELQEALDNNGTSYKRPVIALIDTGVNDCGNVIEAVSVVGDSVKDENGHGTRMAKFITEQNPEAQILSIKALGENGQGDVSAVYAAIQYAIEKNVSIINLSVAAVKKTDHAALVSIINEAVEKGIKVVGAAGNFSNNASYFIPGSIESAIIIGACDERGVLIPSSNFGATVDFYVVAESTSEATAVYSGLLSVGKGEPDDELVYRNTKTEEEIEAEEESAAEIEYSMAYKEYILSNARADLTGKSQFEMSDILLLKPTIADSSMLVGPVTIDNADNCNAFIGTDNITVILYDLDPASGYYVGFAEVTNGGAGVCDYTFAYTNLNGEVLGDCIFDTETGLVYIPKRYKAENHNATNGGLMNVQLQTLYLAPSPEALYVNVFTEINLYCDKLNGAEITDEMRENFPKGGATAYSVMNPYVYVQLPAGFAAINNIDVMVNGYPYANWQYDQASGTVAVATRMYGIRNIEVVVSDTAKFSVQNNPLATKIVPYEMAPNSSAVILNFSKKPQVNDVIPISYTEAYVPAIGTIHPDMNAYQAGTGYGYINSDTAMGSNDVYNLITQGGNYDLVVPALVTVSSPIEYQVTMKQGRYTGDGFTMEVPSGISYDLTCMHVSNPASYDLVAPVNSADVYEGIGYARVLKVTDNGNSGSLLLGTTCAPLRYGFDGYGVSYQTAVGFLKLDYIVTPDSEKGSLQAQKICADECIPAGKDPYPFKGLKFDVYEDSACTKPAKDTKGSTIQLTAGADGFTEIIEVEIPTGGKDFYVRENKASMAGTAWVYNDTVVKITVTKDNTPTAPMVAKVANHGNMDPVGILVQKLDKKTGKDVRRVEH